MEVLLEGDRISKFFGGLEAIHDLSFQVPKGDITGLIGPNGAGKTTLINLITAIHPLSAGKIRFKGKDITHAKSYEIGQMGIARTFQIVKPFSGMTVEENILIGAWFGKSGMKRTKQEALEKVGQVLELVGLKKKQGALVEQTTIPDRKKLELAKALAMEPELLFLDEVMAGLTPKETEDMMVLVKDLKRKGITILVIEHVMKAIMGISDQILVLDQGKLIAQGTPEGISTNERVIEAYLGARYAQKRGVGAGHA